MRVGIAPESVLKQNQVPIMTHVLKFFFLVHDKHNNFYKFYNNDNEIFK